MADNFPKLRKRIKFLGPGSSKNVLIKMNLKRPQLKHIIISFSKVKGKVRLLKVVREKQLVKYKETPKAYQQIFQQKLCRPEVGGIIQPNC